jgi:hypothetical protein
MLPLFRTVQGAHSFEVLPVSFSSPGYLWNSPRLAGDSDQHAFSSHSGNCDHFILNFPIGQHRPLDFELGPGLACLVHGCDKQKDRAETLDRPKRKIQ